MADTVTGKAKLTATSAVTFDHRSAKHSAMLRDAAMLRGCRCEPYKDWFTYRRWQALGYQVRKGEHGIHLSVYVESEVQDADTGDVRKETHRGGTTVFCRCQVDKK
jgi:antirestriction protein ArdC